MYREKLDAYIDSKKEEMLEDLMTAREVRRRRVCRLAKDRCTPWKRHRG